VYKVVLSKEAAKYYQKADKSTRNRLDDALDAITNNPFNVQHHDIKPLQEPLRGLWRYRVGKLRIVYGIDKKTKQIQVVTIHPRGNIYAP